MGWWDAEADGSSFAEEETGLVWGDDPADILGDALTKIITAFIRDIGRKPTEEELVAGMRFSAQPAIDLYRGA